MEKFKDNELWLLIKDYVSDNLIPACSGDLKAQYNYAFECSDTGNKKAALFWMTKSAEGGCDVAQLHLGLWYRQGKNGLEIDCDKAEEWYKKAADQGNGTAWHNIGCLYDFGWGKDIDTVKAYIYYQKSLELGCHFGMQKIGLAHLKGNIEGYDKDYQKAYELFSKAIEKGDKESYYYLSNMFANGYHVEHNIREAISHLETGAEKGSKSCMDKLKIIRQKLL